MRRKEFEHVIAAAAAVTGQDEIVVIGSQAVLGTDPDPPEAMTRSIEVDVYPLRAPQKAIEIDGALGDGSQFHRTFGYYAHGVGPETAVAPRGWQDRLVRVPIPARPSDQRPATALCLEIHDLVLAKCMAGRDRDWEFADAAVEGGLARVDELARRATLLERSGRQRQQITAWLAARRA